MSALCKFLYIHGLISLVLYFLGNLCGLFEVRTFYKFLIKSATADLFFMAKKHFTILRFKNDVLACKSLLS